MKKLMMVMVAAGIAGLTSGCSKEDPKSQPPAATPAAPTTSGTTAPAPTKPADPAAKPAEAKPAAESLTQETPQGAAKLFVAAMGAADFERAVELADPACEARGELETMLTTITQAESKNAEIAQLLIVSFAGPWKGAQIVEGVEEGKNAKYQFKLNNNSVVDVTMQKTDNKWYVFATKDILRPQASGTATPARPAPTPAPAPAPTQPAPTPQ